VTHCPGYARGETVATTLGALRGEGNTPPVTVEVTPGTSWRYSGGGYTVMQLAMEDVTHMPFATLMDSLVFRPLGMTRSSYAQPLPAARWCEAASSHDHDHDGTVMPEGWRIHPSWRQPGSGPRRPTWRASIATTNTVEGTPATFTLTWTDEGFLRLAGGMILSGDLIPIAQTTPVDGDNHRVLRVDWDGDRLVRLVSRTGLAAIPNR